VAEIIRKLGISKQTSSEEAVRRARHRRAASASNLGGGEQQARANGCRPEPRQEDSTGRVYKKLWGPRSSVFWCGRRKWSIGWLSADRTVFPGFRERPTATGVGVTRGPTLAFDFMADSLVGEQ
jgi:hypothetical protein